MIDNIQHMRHPRAFMTIAPVAILLMLAGKSSSQSTSGGTAPATRGAVPMSYVMGEPLRIGNTVQLLADDYVVEDRWMLTRKVGTTYKYMKNPVIVGDKPWEDKVGGYPCVLFDEKMGKYRMWYQCFDLTNYFARQGPNYYVGYAESDDGFNWTKPALEGFPFGGHAKTNIVSTGRGGRRASGMQVFLNPDQSNPARRFMMVYIGSFGIDLAYSPDGLHWTDVEKPMFEYHSDFPNHLVWLPEQHLWYLYLRAPVRAAGTGALPEGLRHTGRRLGVSTSSDLVQWSMPRMILYPDERGQPDYDAILVFRRHGLFLALYSEMFQEKGNSENEMHVATSRDGIHWDRTWDRKPLIPRGPAGSYDYGQVEPGTSPPIEMREDLLIYYYSYPVGQGGWGADTGVGVARLRRDRFIGQWAGDQTGYLVTRQFVLEGTRLRINCSSVPGPYYKETDGIWVEILEAPDFKTRETKFEKKVPGFTMEDCDRIVTDNLAHTVTWKKNADLSSLKGRPIYLRFKMKRAGLFGFQIDP